jgi:type VI secretion system secreted protein VgrG
MKRFTVAAGELVSVFAQKLGIKLFAAKGKVDIQAQSDAIAINAKEDIVITSNTGKLVLAADKEIWLCAGGSYIKITPEGIENGTPGDITEKCAIWDKQGATSQAVEVNQWHGAPFDERVRLTLRDGTTPAANHRYEYMRADGSKITGVTDQDGWTTFQNTAGAEPLGFRWLGKSKEGQA